MKKTVRFIIIAIIIIVIIVLLVVLNINKNNRESETDGIKRIVTSFYPMYIIAENITDGAKNIELVNMTDVNVGCLHDYTLTTEDMKNIEDADIFIANGLGMESFIDKILESNENMYVIDSSTNIENIISDEDETNAHIWTNIDNYILQVKNISQELIAQDSENAAIYEENTKIYVEKLEELRDRFLSELETLNGKKAVCLNEAFEYMGQELGLEITTIETNHEESTMSAEMLKNIIDKVNEENIQIIIIDKNDNKASAETIASETGATIYVLDSGLTGSLDKDAYINAMEENIEQLLSSII